MTHQVSVGQTKVAFSHTEVINGIQKISFPHAVFAHQAIDSATAANISMGVIFKIGKLNLL